MREQESPMHSDAMNRKRNRTQCETEDAHESALNMDLDQGECEFRFLHAVESPLTKSRPFLLTVALTDYKSVNDLSLEELKIAQTIAIEKLQKVLFIDVELPSVASKEDAPILPRFELGSRRDCLMDTTKDKAHPLAKFVTGFGDLSFSTDMTSPRRGHNENGVSPSRHALKLDRA